MRSNRNSMLKISIVVFVSCVTSRFVYAQESVGSSQSNEIDLESKPLAGYSSGLFYLRSRDDNFIFNPMGRLHLDTYGYAGSGVRDYRRSNGSGLTPNLSVRRLRVELNGQLYKKLKFYFSGEFAQKATVDAQQRGVSAPAVMDALVAYEFDPAAVVQIGQFAVPFGMENSISSKYWDFMDRGLLSTAVATPLRRDFGLMVRGETKKKHFTYAIGYFGGEGFNRISLDHFGDFIGRIFVQPLASLHRFPLREFHIGISGRWGVRNPGYVRYDAPSMSTPGNYTFWSPVYGTGANETHVIPSKTQRALGLEFFLPYKRFDFRGELVFSHDERREAFAQSLNNTERSGTLSGTTYSIQLAWWPWGPVRMPGGHPGHYNFYTPKLSWGSSKPKSALQVVARWEQMLLNYNSIARSYDSNGTLLPNVVVGGLDSSTQNIRVNAFQLGANYWLNNHFRLTAQWNVYMFPGVPMGTGNSQELATNQAVAPGASANARNGEARTLHEFSARVAVSF